MSFTATATYSAPQDCQSAVEGTKAAAQAALGSPDLRMDRVSISHVQDPDSHLVTWSAAVTWSLNGG